MNPQDPLIQSQQSAQAPVNTSLQPLNPPQRGKAGPVIATLSFVFAILFAPLGLLLSVITIVIGAKRPVRIGILLSGCISLFLSLIVSLIMIAFVVLPALQRKGANYSDLTPQSYVVGGVTIGAQLPGHYELKGNDGGYASFAPAGNNKTTRALLDFIVTPQLMTDEEAIVANGYTSSEQGKVALAQLADIYTADIQTACKNVKLDSIVSGTVTGAKAVYTAKFTCDSNKIEGLTYSGTYLDAFTGKHEVKMLLVAETANAKQNSVNIEKTIQSLKLAD